MPKALARVAWQTAMHPCDPLPRFPASSTSKDPSPNTLCPPGPLAGMVIVNMLIGVMGNALEKVCVCFCCWWWWGRTSQPLLRLQVFPGAACPAPSPTLPPPPLLCPGRRPLHTCAFLGSSSLRFQTGEHSALKMLLHKALIIDEMEAAMPRWLEERFRGAWYPDHIHILRVDPDRWALGRALPHVCVCWSFPGP